MKKIIRFFSSIKLAIILLICLAFTSIIGTVIAQKQSPVLYIQHYGEGLFKFFNFMGFFDVYHSWWFIALLVILAINILFCSLRRLARDLKHVESSPVKLDKETAKRFKLSHHIVFKRSIGECKDVIISVLKGRFKAPPKAEYGKNGEIDIFFEKNRNGWIYFHITHVSILIILLGGILSATLGIKGYMQIIEGESADEFYEYNSNKRHKLDFVLKCERFEIEYYPQSARPKDYRSSLIVIDQGKEVLKKVIEVNKPLTYQGITFYQSNYGEDPSSGKLVFEIKSNNPQSKEPVREFMVSPGGGFEFGGEDGKKREVKVLQFLPDFGMNAQGRAFSKSNQLKNPAAQIMVTKEGEQPFNIWSFKMFPDFQMIKKGEYLYNFKAYRGKMYTGLQVGKDKGVVVVWIGCFFLMLGVILVLFSSHQRIWVKLVPHPEGCDSYLVGHTNKNKPGFETNFSNIWQEIKDSLAH